MKIDKYVDNYSTKNKFYRLLWNIFHLIFIRPFALPHFNKWRITMYKLWGSEIGKGSIIYASSTVWLPRNLKIGSYTCIGPNTRVYNPGLIEIGDKVAISQYSYLCTATHDYTLLNKPLFWKSIKIESFAWVAAEAFVGPNVTIGKGAIVGARAVVFKDVKEWTIVAGNPAKFIKKRELKHI